MYDQVLEFMESRTPTDNSIVHVINIDIQDNLEEATIGAFLISDMCIMVSYKFSFFMEGGGKLSLLY